MSDDGLRQLQNWLLQVITHPGGVAAGLDSPFARQARDVPLEQLEGTIRRSVKQTSVERLEVYAIAYYARLLACLRELFPCLQFAIGDESFTDFALLYLQQHPPTHYSLNHLADHFVEFLAANRPAEDSGELSWPDFMIDLARLEQAIEQVFDGPGSEETGSLSTVDLQALDPERFSATRLTLTPGLQLLACRFPVSSYYTAWKAFDHESQLPLVLPAAAEQYVAVFRRDYIVRRHELSRPQYELLSALQFGAIVGKALESALPHISDFSAFAGDLRRWFHFWAAEQFFAPLTS